MRRQTNALGTSIFREEQREGHNDRLQCGTKNGQHAQLTRLYRGPRQILLQGYFSNGFPIDVVSLNQGQFFGLERTESLTQSFVNMGIRGLFRRREQRSDLGIGMPFAQQSPVFGLATTQCGVFRQFAHPCGKLFYIRNIRSFRNGLA